MRVVRRNRLLKSKYGHMQSSWIQALKKNVAFIQHLVEISEQGATFLCIYVRKLLAYVTTQKLCLFLCLFLHLSIGTLTSSLNQRRIQNADFSLFFSRLFSAQLSEKITKIRVQNYHQSPIM